MHFWIDKRSQGCGFNRRPRHLVVPPTFACGHGRNRRLLYVGLHPKPMVTPVHRFQSIESVANNAIRHSRAHGGPRATTSADTAIHINTPHAASCNSSRGRTLVVITRGPAHRTPTPRRNLQPSTRYKFGIWIFFILVSFFAATCKYYFHGVNIGLEAFAFCALLVIILAIGGLVSLYEAISANAHNLDNTVTLPENTSDETTNHVPNTLPPTSPELPPPPYHIAIMLPSQADAEAIQVIQDSPPPSYEKAVT